MSSGRGEPIDSSEFWGGRQTESFIISVSLGTAVDGIYVFIISPRVNMRIILIA